LATVPKILPSFARSYARLVVAGSPAARAVATTIGQLLRARTLPLADDVEGLLSESDVTTIERMGGRRVLSTYARRVKRRRLWILYFYRPGSEHVELVMLATVAPRIQ
jgi:hypothetical protein